MITILLWAAIGYLLGSIPFGLLLTRAAGGGDIRAIGSGNIGATNVLRTGKKGVAAATLLLDAGKGVLAVWLGLRFGGEAGQLAAAVGAFAGHVHPVWLGFKGGKGVATLFGISVALAPLAGLFFALAWLGVALISRISSLGGISAGFAATVALLSLGWVHSALAVLGLSLWVLFTHRENIARIKAGTEPRIGQKG